MTGAAPVVGRRLFLVAMVAAVVGALFSLSLIYAARTPRPHGVTVAVVGAPVAAVSHGLDRVLPGGFRVVASPSQAAAVAALREQRARGALVVTTSGSARVLTVGTAGTSLQQAVQAALDGAAHHVARRVTDVDAIPLPARDRAGLSVYFLEIGMLLPSVLGSAALYLVGVRSRLWWRVSAAWLFAITAGGLGTVVADPLLGALTGHWLAMWGILSLGALAFVLCVAAAQATFGLPATGVMALAFIFVGNAISGGSIPTGMLPDVYRQLSPGSPNSGIVHSLRAVVYFRGHGLGPPLLVLCIWAATGLAVLVLDDLLHLRARRGLDPDRRPEVYATPAVVHAARMARPHRTPGT